MPDPRVSDEDLKSLTRAYLIRRTSRTSPLDLEDTVMRAALRPTRRRPATTAAAIVGLVLASALTAGLALAFHHPGGAGGATSSSGTPTQVRIVRNPGLLELPVVDRTISDARVAAQLSSDIRGLPRAPSLCIGGGSLGTSYTLTFTGPVLSTWTAAIEVGGCDSVRVSYGPALIAVDGSALWSDLGSALRMTNDELRPIECGGPLPPGYALCYPERPLPRNS